MTVRTFYTFAAAMSLGLTGAVHAQSTLPPAVRMSNPQLADAGDRPYPRRAALGTAPRSR